MHQDKLCGCDRIGLESLEGGSHISKDKLPGVVDTSISGGKDSGDCASIKERGDRGVTLCEFQETAEEANVLLQACCRCKILIIERAGH